MLSAAQTSADSHTQLRGELLAAAKQGDVNAAAKLLRRRRHPFARELLETTYDTEGVPPLHLACKHGHLELAKLFVAEGAKVHATDADPKRRGTAIAYAAWGGHLSVIEFLVQNTKATLDEIDIVGNTPLLYAVFGGHRSVVEALVKAGRSLREINAKAHSALLQAACGGHTELVAWLLDQGFDIGDSDTDGNTALLFAAWGGFLETMHLLLARGAKLSETNDNGHTVLLSAANGGRVDVVEWLLGKGFKLKETNNNGDTALLLAAYGGHIDLCEWLHNRGVSWKETNNCGFTPLLSAANGGQLEMVKWLIKNGAKMDEKDEDGYTPLILAACGGNIKMVEYFLKLGASVTEVNGNGDTPLLLAAYCGHDALVEWLLANGASLSERNGTGMGALISAANGGNVRVVKLLLNRIAVEGDECMDSIESVDQGGYTPLLLAVQRGYPEVVRLLAMHGANLQAKTARLDNGIRELAHPSVVNLVNKIAGMSPIDIAADAGLVDHVHRLVPEAATVSLKDAVVAVQASIESKNADSDAADDDDDADGATLAVAHPVPLWPNAKKKKISKAEDAAELENLKAIKKLLAMALQPWAPCRNALFGLKSRRRVWTLSLVAQRLANIEHLPHLPQEMWYFIITFFGRDADHVQEPRPAADAPVPLALANSEEQDFGVELDEVMYFAAGLPGTPLKTSENSDAAQKSMATPSALALLLTPSVVSSETSRSVWRARHLLRSKEGSKRDITAATRRLSTSLASSAFGGGSSSGAAGDSTPVGSNTDDEVIDPEDSLFELGQARQELFP